MTLTLNTAVTHYPRAKSDPEKLPAGTAVQLVRRISAVLFLVTISDHTETFPVLASEVETNESPPA